MSPLDRRVSTFSNWKLLDAEDGTKLTATDLTQRVQTLRALVSDQRSMMIDKLKAFDAHIGQLKADSVNQQTEIRNILSALNQFLTV